MQMQMQTQNSFHNLLSEYHQNYQKQFTSQNQEQTNADQYQERLERVVKIYETAISNDIVNYANSMFKYLGADIESKTEMFQGEKRLAVYEKETGSLIARFTVEDVVRAFADGNLLNEKV